MIIINEASTYMNDVAVNKFMKEKTGLPISKLSSDPKKESLIFLLSPDIESTIRTLNNNRFFKNKYHQSYHIDWFINRYFGRILVKEKLDLDEYYGNIKRNCPNISFMKKKPSEYNDRNLFVDLHHYNNLFFSNLISETGKHNIESYLDLLKELVSDNRYNKYTHKSILFDIDDWITNVRDTSNFRFTNNNNPFSYLYQWIKFNFDKFLDLNIEWILTSKRGYIKFDFKEFKNNKEAASRFKELVSKLYNKDDADTIENANPEITNKISKNFNNDIDIVDKKSIAKSVANKVSNSLDKKDENKEISRVIEDALEDKTFQTEDEAMEVLNSDEDVIIALNTFKNNQIYQPTAGRLEREKQLKSKFKSIDVNGTSVEEILKQYEETNLPVRTIKADIINEELKENSMVNFDKSYDEKLKKAHIIKMIESFSDERKTAPLSVVDINMTDASDEFNLQEKLEVIFEDRKGKRHKVNIMVPYLIDNMSLYLYGSKKDLNKQQTLKPVVKTRHDTVQVTTNYNKIFCYRHGDNTSPKVTRISKVLANTKSEHIEIDTGHNIIPNSNFKTTIEYDDLSSKYNYINIDGVHIGLNQLILRKELLDKKLVTKKYLDEVDEIIPIGWNSDNKLIELHSETNRVYINKKESDLELIDYIIQECNRVDQSFQALLNKTTVGKRYMYTRCKMMNEFVPMIVLLSYSEGLFGVMNKAGIKYTVHETRPKLDAIEKDNKGIVEFEDSYLVYDRYPFANSILMNGLNIIPTKSIKLEAMQDKSAYLDIFDLLFSRRNIGNSYDNFYELFIDPMTKYILEMLSLPTDYVELMLYANELLADNSFIPENKMPNCRIRSGEIINAMIYKELATAYENYRMTASYNNPKKMSIKQDAIIKNLLTSPIVEEHSSLNPILDAEKSRTVGSKGPNGINKDRAYTLNKRVFDETQTGILALSSPPSGKVGITRQLAIDPNIESNMGYVKVTDSDNYDDLHFKTLMCPAEALTPFSTRHDDAPRIAMNTTQQKHVINIEGADQLIVTNGFDKVMYDMISDQFCFKAKQDGKIIDIDKKRELIVVEYKDGTKDIIRLNTQVEKNAGGGFYITNKLSTDLKVGDVFTERSAIAYNKEYFDTDIFGNITFKSGALVNVGIMSGYYTYEDSTSITERLSKKMSTKVVMDKKVGLEATTNVSSMVKIGDKVKVGTPLLVFEEYQGSEEFAQLFSTMGEELGEEINAMGRSLIKSKYSGVIEDIKIFYTCELDEMTPSLRAIVEEYNKNMKSVKRKIDKNIPERIDRHVMVEPSDKVKAINGKVRGVNLESGVLIEFYIKYDDYMGIGDKITFYTALKGIVGEIIPNGKEPYLLRDENELIDAFISPTSIDARMTSSIKIAGCCNKVFIELKKKLKEIYNS